MPDSKTPQPFSLPPCVDLGSKIACFSRNIARIPGIESMLGVEKVLLRPRGREAKELSAVVGWGNRPNTRAARKYARRHGLPYVNLEDGFLRSVGLGVHGAIPLSMIVDDRGIYYDARHPSRLEDLLLEDADWMRDEALMTRARRCIRRICEAGLSKYNHAPVTSPPASEGLPRRKRVLVVDQTRGDRSVEGALANAASFLHMLECARSENPEAELLIKTHPDVISGKKKGFLEQPEEHARLRILREDIPAMSVLDSIDKVYTVSSQLGFEALLSGKPVVCFGVPFYAGWGLTDDRVAAPRRNHARDLEQIFVAAYILYPRYIDPDSGEPCQIERVIEHLALQREIFARNNTRVFCFGFSLWRRSFAADYLRSPGSEPVFVSGPAAARSLGFDSTCAALVWGGRARPEIEALAADTGAPLWRMEDGFLRSVGLGSDLDIPASLVIDRSGLYYDPSGPGDLETILMQTDFDEEDLLRAKQLRALVVNEGISKYNVGDRGIVDITASGGRRVVLVPGQVEDDASVEMSCQDVRGNRALLEAARACEPDAYLIFKPHPDVVSGNRKGHVSAEQALRYCDQVVTGPSLPSCLEVADAVHTMCSLVGFEGLLRGLEVTTHGRPFYAGWGLTDDRLALPRRTRRLTLDQLVAGTLIHYPRYLNPETRQFTTPEAVIAALGRRRRGAGRMLQPDSSRLSRTWHKVVALVESLRHVR